MFNKNDPLIASVKQVMEQNAKERAAINAVNEKFGITSRKALPHERQGEWDAAYKAILSESVIAEDELNDKGKGPKKKAETYVHKTSGKEIVSTSHPGKEWELVKEELKGNQPKLDVNKNKQVDSQDLKALRMKKILQRRFGKPGMESPSQSRREDK